MSATHEKKDIYESIQKVMEDIGAVGKDSVNKQQGFKFRGIDAVMNALQPALVKNHVFIVPEILDQTREERVTKGGAHMIYSICKIKYTFYAEDGSFIEAVTIGEGMDSGDKATNKAMAIAFKYACFQVFCIPTEEMKDPDEESPEIISEKKSPEKTKQEKPMQNKSMQSTTPDTLPDPDEVASSVIDQAKINTINSEIKRTGIDISVVLKSVHAKSIDTMTVDQFLKVMRKFKVTQDAPIKETPEEETKNE